jgi:hypothetical protein
MAKVAVALPLVARVPSTIGKALGAVTDALHHRPDTCLRVTLLICVL